MRTGESAADERKAKVAVAEQRSGVNGDYQLLFGTILFGDAKVLVLSRRAP